MLGSVADLHIGERGGKPPQGVLVVTFGRRGAGQVVAVDREPGDGELGRDTAGSDQRMRETDSADSPRRAVCPEALDEGRCVSPRDLELRERGEIHQTDPIAHRPTLGRNRLAPRGTKESEWPLRGIVARPWPRDSPCIGVGCEPVRPLPSMHAPEHRAARGLSLVNRGHTEWTSCRPFLEGKVNTELKAEALPGLRDAVVTVRVAAEPPGIDCQRVHRRCAVDHPVGEEAAGAPAFHHPHARPRAQPRAVEAEGRTNKRIRVGRERDRPVHNRLDAGGRKRGHPLHGHRDDGLDPLQIRRQQLHAELRWNAVHTPRASVRFVGTDDEAVAFLAQVPAFLRVADHRELRLPSCRTGGDLRHVGGDQVLVQHRHHRQVQPYHLADFAAPGSRCVDDVRRPDGAPVGMDDPCARCAAFDCPHRFVATDLPAPRTCPGGEGPAWRAWGRRGHRSARGWLRATRRRAPADRRGPAPPTSGCEIHDPGTPRAPVRGGTLPSARPSV